MSNKDVKTLNKIISINKDAAKFYRDAKVKAESLNLEQNFSALKSLHEGVVDSLKKEVIALGGQIEDDQTMTGKITQFYGQLMTDMSANPDETLVKHLEEAEDRCLHAVRDAKQDHDLMASTRSILSRELKTLQRSHDYMKACMKKAA